MLHLMSYPLFCKSFIIKIIQFFDSGYNLLNYFNIMPFLQKSFFEFKDTPISIRNQAVGIFSSFLFFSFIYHKPGQLLKLFFYYYILTIEISYIFIFFPGNTVIHYFIFITIFKKKFSHPQIMISFF